MKMVASIEAEPLELSDLEWKVVRLALREAGELPCRSESSPVRRRLAALWSAVTGWEPRRPLADPKLEIYSGNTVVAANDNWDAAATPAATKASVGAFALPAGSKDAVLIVTLAPGSYTAQVSGVGNTTGLGLVELYELP